MDVIIPFVSVLAGASVGAAAMHFLRRSKRGDQTSLSSGIIENIDCGYYLRDIASGEEQLSGHLRQMLGLAETDTGFEALLSKLGEAYRAPVRQAVEDLQKSSTPTIIVMNMPDGRQFECRVTGKYESEEHRLTHIIIFIRDTSGAQKIHDQLTNENRQLKRDIKQFSNILNTLPVPVWLRGEDQVIRYCNMAYSITAEENLDDQKDDHETLELHPYARPLAKTAFEGDQVKSERRHIVVEGARKLYEFTETPLKADRVTVGLAQDITELENVQEELQRHVYAQSELLESVTSAMAVFGADTKLKFFNQAYVRLWGLDEAWLDTSPPFGEILELLREKRRLPEQANFPQFKQQRMKAFKDLIEPTEEIFYLPDGRTLRVLAIPHALGGVLFVYEDVTDRLALERSYNTLIAVQRATLDNLHEGVVVFGEDGRLRLYNPRFLQLWKLEKVVLSPATHIADLFEKTRPLHFADDWESYKQKFISGLLSREVQHKRIERTDGSLLDSVVVPLPDGANLITFFDVTDSILVERSLRERNEALSEADRLKTEFLANVSYELRSPLTSISGFSEMLTQNYFGTLSPKQREYMSGIHEASQHLMNLINDILDIASIEAGYMKLNISEFDIQAMLQSVVSLVSERMRESNLQFNIECPDNIGRMAADETRIKQIIFNLLSNAIKYSNPGGQVTLAAQVTGESGDELVFTIEDNGIGISPEEQKEIFNKFQRGSNTSTHKSGAGLGLSMVKSFVALHGGRVELDSMPGRGTKVSCYVPRVCRT
ncbi:MAG TPA: ATP-binding protein [Rickettsiales bacterium]|nr:ATP-binding protein [Rickettsiales bacterium]